VTVADRSLNQKSYFPVKFQESVAQLRTVALLQRGLAMAPPRSPMGRGGGLGGTSKLDGDRRGWGVRRDPPVGLGRGGG